MEAGILSKSLTGLLFASTLVYLVFLRAWRIRRLWERRVSSVDGLFLTALAMGLAAIYAESPFQNLSVLLIEYTGLPETVLQIDMQIEFIKQLPQEVWNDLVMRFGWDEPAPLPAPPTEPFASRVFVHILGRSCTQNMFASPGDGRQLAMDPRQPDGQV